VDDREENVAAALQAGLRAFQAKGGAEVIEGLQRHGVAREHLRSKWVLGEEERTKGLRRLTAVL